MTTIAKLQAAEKRVAEDGLYIHKDHPDHEELIRQGLMERADWQSPGWFQITDNGESLLGIHKSELILRRYIAGLKLPDLDLAEFAEVAKLPELVRTRFEFQITQLNTSLAEAQNRMNILLDVGARQRRLEPYNWACWDERDKGDEPDEPHTASYGRHIQT